MTRMKLLVGALLLIGALGTVPNALAACAPGTGGAGVACLHYLAAGSSAMFQGFGVSVVNTIAPTILPGGGSIHHYTFKSANPPGELAALLRDTRSGLQGTTIPDEPATLWVAYICTSAPGGQCTTGTATDVWAYLQVDSTVGVRSIMARASGGGVGVNSVLDGNTRTSVAGTNVISPVLFNFGAPSWGAGDTTCTGGSTACDDQFLVPEVFAAINSRPINVGSTDIRFEDAKYATKRSTAPPSNGSGLGYGTVGSQLVGTSIQSQFSHTLATPVEFGLPGGGDPISSQGVPATLVSIPVGEAPILVIANRSSGTGLGALDAGGAPAFADVEDDNGAKANRLSNLFSGNTCAGSNTTFRDIGGTTQSLTAAGIGDFPVHLIQREPLSGTFNTFEFTEIRTANGTSGNNTLGTWNNAAACSSGSGARGGTQECGVNGATNNPLNLSCFSGGGTRQRAIGTGEEVSTVAGLADRLGYAFFSFANVKSISLSNSFGYLTIDGVDPIFNNYTGGDPGQPAGTVVGARPGQLPFCNPGGGACATNTIWTGGNSFPHLRDGTYRSWSLLRQICDTNDNNCTIAHDPVGAEAIIQAAANDIHNNDPNSVADYLPVQDIGFIRSHFNFKQFSNTEHSIPFVHFADIPFSILDIPATAGELAGGPGVPGPAAQGGDAGGCILPKNLNNNTVVNITVAQKSGTTMKFTYTPNSGAGLSVGDKISIYGFGNANDGANFAITTVVAGPPQKFWVVNSSGVAVASAPAGTIGANGPTNCSQ